MRYERVHIQALSYVLPPIEITTASLERMLGPLFRRIGVPDGVLEALTGVEARRFWPEGRLTSQGSAQVARELIEQHGVPPCGIQALVSTSVCKDYLEPPAASLVAGDLGLGADCMNFDVGHACLGFMTGMLTVANLIELGQIECGLVVAGEGSRGVTQATIRRLLQPGVDFHTFAENLATLTLGSMATAALLVHERHSAHGHRLLGGATRAATHHSRLCLGTHTEMKTDATTLLREGVALARDTFAAAAEELQLQVPDVREFVLHQVGKANHDALIDRLGLPPGRALRLYPQHGNVGAAGIPFTLASAIERGRIKLGDTAMLMGIGSGLNCTMLGVRW
ncbi:MAG TPA: 3-oxoacyl-ACP synthase III [Deltaproteobacteria bacterium]|nr:3-oxoacyl-ACP synthase III [Deltaproteobacteria bacterium]